MVIGMAATRAAATLAWYDEMVHKRPQDEDLLVFRKATQALGVMEGPLDSSRSSAGSDPRQEERQRSRHSQEEKRVYPRIHRMPVLYAQSAPPALALPSRRLQSALPAPPTGETPPGQAALPSPTPHAYNYGLPEAGTSIYRYTILDGALTRWQARVQTSSRC